MKYRTGVGLSVGAMVVVIVLNIVFFVVVGGVAWHFIAKFW